MQNTLLNFFYERSNILKSSTGFSASDTSKVVAKYKFIVSNYRTDEANTIEIKSLNELKTAIGYYYEDTDNIPDDFISKPESLDEDKIMFVHLQLP
jgi:hypothetical protein